MNAPGAMRWTLLAGLAAIAVGCGGPPPPAAESTDEVTTVFTGGTEEIPIPETLDLLLNDVAKSYSEVPTWDLVATSVRTPPKAFAAPAAVVDWRLDFVRPNKFRLESTPAGATSPRSLLISDGEVRTLYFSTVDQFSQAEAPASLAAALDDREFVLGDGSNRRLIAPFLEQAAWEAYWAKAENKEKIELLLRDDVEQFHCRWTHGGSQWIADIQAKDPKRILRLEAVTPTATAAGRDATGYSVVETYKYVDPPSPEAFKFSPPVTSMLVRDLALTELTSEDALASVVGSLPPDVPLVASNAPAGTAPAPLSTLVQGRRVGGSMVRQPTIIFVVDLKSPDTAKLVAHWQEVASLFSGRNLKLMFICEGAAPADAQAAARKFGLPVDAFYADNASGVLKTLPVRALPVTLIADRMGVVRRSLLSLSPAWNASVTAAAQALLEQQDDAARMILLYGANPPPAELVKGLGHLDPLVRQVASRKLREMKAEGIPVLIVGTTAIDPRVRLLSLSLLSELAPKSADLAPVLVNSLKDPRPDVRTQARNALVRMGTPAIGLLRASLASPDTLTRREAVQALGRMRYRAYTSIPDIALALGDPDAGVRKAAGDSLVRLGRKSLPSLAEALKNPSPVVHNAAARTLVLFGSRGARVFVETLRSPPEFFAAVAGKYGPNFAPADAAKIQEALRVYEATKTLKDRMTADLVTLLGDPQVNLGAAAVEVLASRGDAAVADVTTVLASDKAQVRRLAAETLGRIGPPAESSWPFLKVLLSDKSPDVREAAAEACGKLGPNILEPLTAELKGAQDKRLKSGVIRALAEMGPAAANAHELFAEALVDADKTLSAAGAEALGAIGAAGLPALLAGLDHADIDVQVAASKGLGRMGGEAVESLTQRLADPKPARRVWAAVALGEMGAEAQPTLPLLRALKRDADANVSQNAADAEKKIEDALGDLKDEEPTDAPAPVPAETLVPDAPEGAPTAGAPATSPPTTPAGS